MIRYQKKRWLTARSGFGAGIVQSAVFISLQAVVEASHMAPAISILCLSSTCAMILGLACASSIMGVTLKPALSSKLLELNLDPALTAEVGFENQKETRTTKHQHC